MIERGDLWWADLGPARGLAPAYRRPVLVISADAYNRSRIQTVICAVVTSNLRLASAPGNVVLPACTEGLERESVVNVSQVVTLDKVELTERAGRVGPPTLRAVDAGLRRALSL